MKSFSEKHPIIFEIILIIIGLVLAGVASGVLAVFGCDDEVSGAVARILVGIVFLVVFHRSFRFDKCFKGFVPMLPALLLALYKIPYYYISGGETINAITVPILLIGFAPAIFEEVLFRGIFISNLKKKFNKPSTVVLVSAVVFSLMHLTNIGGMDVVSVLLQVIVAMAAGIAFGAIYLYTEDIVSVIIAHFLVDVLSGIFINGETTPYYFLVIFVVICCFEIIYGLLLAKKIKSSNEEISES